MDNARAGVFYKDQDGVLWPYCPSVCSQILQGIREGLRTVEAGPAESSISIDLRAMKQRKKGRFQERNVVIQIPWNCPWLQCAMDSLQNRPSASATCSRELVERTVDRLREHEFLELVLRLKRVPFALVEVNPHLERGHEPYDNFVSSLLTEIRESNDDMLCEAMLQMAKLGDPTSGSLMSMEECGLRFVFHGTGEGEMGNICKTGLLPSFRKSGEADWFGETWEISIQYSRRAQPANHDKLLFFLLLVPSAQSSFYSAFTSSSNKFQLPVAQITIALP